MASAWPIAAPISWPISSLQYGKCHWSGASTTPSSETNSDTITLLTSGLLFDAVHGTRYVGGVGRPGSLGRRPPQSPANAHPAAVSGNGRLGTPGPSPAAIRRGPSPRCPVG